MYMHAAVFLSSSDSRPRLCKEKVWWRHEWGECAAVFSSFFLFQIPARASFIATSIKNFTNSSSPTTGRQPSGAGGDAFSQMISLNSTGLSLMFPSNGGCRRQSRLRSVWRPLVFLKLIALNTFAAMITSTLSVWPAPLCKKEMEKKRINQPSR